MATQTYVVVVHMHDINRGDRAEMVFNYRLNEQGAFTPWSWAGRLADEFIAGPLQDLVDMVSSSMVIDSVHCRRVTSNGGLTAVKIVATVGGNGGLVSSIAEGARIAWVPGGEADHWGGNIVPGLPAGSFVSGAFSGGFQTLADDFVQAMLVQLTLAGGAGTADFVIRSIADGSNVIVIQGELRPRPGIVERRTLG